MVPEFGKFRYNMVPMGLCFLVIYFKIKLKRFLVILRGLRRIFDNILVLGKGGFSQHMDQIIMTSSRLRAAGLKVNGLNYSFWVKGDSIPRLYYIMGMD